VSDCDGTCEVCVAERAIIAFLYPMLPPIFRVPSICAGLKERAKNRDEIRLIRERELELEKERTHPMTPTQRPPLKAGDIVRVYGTLRGELSCNGERAEVMPDVCPQEGWITVKFKQGNITYFKWVHPKQCRRIKPRRKPREWWVCQDTDGNVMTFGGKTLYTEEARPGVYQTWKWIKVREVLKPRREREG
jgi:hypothetical protein